MHSGGGNVCSNSYWPYLCHPKIRKIFTCCSWPWRIRTRETSCFELCYSRLGRVDASERFAFTGNLTVFELVLYWQGKGPLYWSRPWHIRAMEIFNWDHTVIDPVLQRQGRGPLYWSRLCRIRAREIFNWGPYCSRPCHTKTWERSTLFFLTLPYKGKGDI